MEIGSINNTDRNVNFGKYYEAVDKKALRNDVVRLIRPKTSKFFNRQKTYELGQKYYEGYMPKLLKGLKIMGNTEYADVSSFYDNKIFSVFIRNNSTREIAGLSLNLNTNFDDSTEKGRIIEFMRNCLNKFNEVTGLRNNKNLNFSMLRTDAIIRTDYDINGKLKRLTFGDHIMEFDTTYSSQQHQHRLQRYFFKGKEAKSTDSPLLWTINNERYYTNITGDEDVQEIFEDYDIDTSVTGMTKRLLDAEEKRREQAIERYILEGEADDYEEAEELYYNDMRRTRRSPWYGD